ncbi:hypothetical protein, partial [Frankia sp. AgKG'84/4]|uniref:hypothetical protein n=1 Tax=Frankia sp. AgKG'84/4 TaxID=573490 RepID=UPI00202A1DC5
RADHAVLGEGGDELAVRGEDLTSAAGAGPGSGAVLPRILSAVVQLSGAPRVIDVPAAVADPAVVYR